MIAAIMQPYFFPYIGYFQLMRAVDIFVFFDDVQYIDRGWVNRNQLPINGKAAWITMPVNQASRSLPINRRTYLLKEGVPVIRRKIHAAYAKYLKNPAHEIIEDCLSFQDDNVARFNSNLLGKISEFLGSKCRLIYASELMSENEPYRAEARIIELCKRLNATHYINLIGGSCLYDSVNFSNEGIKLSFLRSTVPLSCAADDPRYFSIIHDLLDKSFNPDLMMGCFEIVG